jgi:predicted TIM-barrel enzyme
MSVEIYPVVHINDVATAVEQVDKSFAYGADGVYLIDHGVGGSATTLLSTFEMAKTAHPDQYIGVNILAAGSSARALSRLETARQQGIISRLPDGLWVDDAKHDLATTTMLREQYPNMAAVRLLGGTAFKYTRSYTDDPEKAALEAQALAPYIDVVTTSGEGTGMAPSVAKIIAMKQAIGDQKLAVASGITIENIQNYDGAVDELLVSTSVETAPYSGVFDDAKLQALITKAHQLG